MATETKGFTAADAARIDEIRQRTESHWDLPARGDLVFLLRTISRLAAVEQAARAVFAKMHHTDVDYESQRSSCRCCKADWDLMIPANEWHRPSCPWPEFQQALDAKGPTDGE